MNERLKEKKTLATHWYYNKETASIELKANTKKTTKQVINSHENYAINKNIFVIMFQGSEISCYCKTLLSLSDCKLIFP